MHNNFKKPIKFRTVVKNVAIFMYSIVFFVTLTYCGWWLGFRPDTPLEEVIPWGTWESKNPPIRLYIHPELKFPLQSYFTYPAIYKTNENNVNIFADFNTQAGITLAGQRAHIMKIFCADGNIISFASEWDGFSVENDILNVVARDGRVLTFLRVVGYHGVCLSDWDSTIEQWYQSGWPTPLS